MTASSSSPAQIKPIWRDPVQAARYYLSGWRAWVGLAAVVIGAGFVLKWNWLVAAGIAPLLGAVLPCMAMCALHLCMNRSGGSDCKQTEARH